MPAPEKVYFVSDAHLGTPDRASSLRREKALVNWLDHIAPDAASIYLMGDIFDFWYEYRHVVPRGFTRILGKLAELCDQGKDIHFFTGNHDIWTFGYLEEEIGLKVHRHPLLTEILGHTFYLAHGDGFDEADRRFRLIKSIFTNPFLQWAFSKLHPNLAFSLAGKWSRHSRDHQETDPFKEEDEPFVRFARKHLLEEQPEYLVFGHRHVAVQYALNEKTSLTMLGDWLTQYHYAVYDGEKLRLLCFDPHAVK